MISHTHKRVYFNKNKKPNRIDPKCDPISQCVRHSLIAKVNNIYDQIIKLQTQNVPFKQVLTTKNSFLVSKQNKKSNRLSGSVHSLERQTFTSTFKRKSTSISKMCTDSNFYPSEKIVRKSENQVEMQRRPASNSRIRQMLKVRSKFQQQQSSNIRKNPFYKIMKRRVKTHNDQLHEQLSNLEHQKQSLKIQTEYLNDDFKNQDYFSYNAQSYSQKFHNRTGEKQLVFQPEQQHYGIRQKSQTKIYEEIKKYFQQKYGPANKNQVNNSINLTNSTVRSKRSKTHQR